MPITNDDDNDRHHDHAAGARQLSGRRAADLHGALCAAGVPLGAVSDTGPESQRRERVCRARELAEHRAAGPEADRTRLDCRELPMVEGGSGAAGREHPRLTDATYGRTAVTRADGDDPWVDHGGGAR